MPTESLVIQVELDNGKVIKGTAQIPKALSSAGKKGAESLESSFSGAIRNVGKKLLALGSAFVGFQAIRSVISNLGGLETAFAEIRTIIPDVTQANEQLRQSLINTSAQFGTSASDQANAFYQIISAGVTDAVKAQDLLVQANKLAIGGLTSTGTAIDVLTSAVNAYGIENLSATKASDILFGTVRLGKTRVEELAGSLGQILPTASSLGVSFEEVSGNLASLTTKGISTSQAVTQLNAVFTAVLKQQDVAKKLGPGVAKAFSLQALQAKGLTNFLRDVNFELGGNEAALVKLLGRAEGARGILALAGDGFKGAADAVNQLKTQTGAADAAFQEINSTLNQQLKILGSQVSAVFLNIGSSSSGALNGIVASLNSFLAAVNNNFAAVRSIVGQATQAFVSFFIAVRIGPSVFSGFSRGIGGLVNQLSILPTRIGLAVLRIKTFKLSLSSFNPLNFIRGLKGIVLGLKSLRIGLKLAKIAASLLKASLTLGLSLVIDFLIEKFLQLKEDVGGLRNAFKFLGLSAQKIFLQIANSVITLVKQLEKVPFVGEKFKAAFGPGLQQTLDNNKKTIDELGMSIDNLFTSANRGPAELEIPAPIPPAAPQAAPAFDAEKFEENRKRSQNALDSLTNKSASAAQAQINIAEQAWGQVASIVGVNTGIAAASVEDLQKTTKGIFNQIGANALQGFAKGFSAVGKAIVEGENAFAAFGQAVLGVVGQIAIEAGTAYLLLGIASYNFAQAAAGAALIVVGGAISALAGGGGGSSGAAGGGTGFSTSPVNNNTNPPPLVASEIAQQQQGVAVNIQGDVLDSDETGLRIATIIKDQFGSNGVQVTS